MTSRRAAALFLFMAAAGAAFGQTTFTLGPYAYDGAGNIRAIGADVFTYDELGRLKSGMAGAAGTQQYTYDGFGNLLSVSTNGATPPELQLAMKDRTNQVALPAEYDGAGQLLSYAGDTFEYDGAGMVTQSKVGTVTKIHIYSAADERVVSITATGTNNDVEVRSEWTMRDASGRVLRRLARESGVWSWREDYIYRGAQLLAAEVSAPERTRHFHLDHLGTPRLITDAGGNELSRHAYFPFGQEATPGNPTGERLKFTGHERDFGVGPGSDLDYMHARYYRVAWGRFLSVDPGKDWDPHKPQSWNMYAYVRNNPINTTDPTGKWGWSDFRQWARDTREGISNWWQEKWHKDIPAPPDQYGGVEALEAADLSPEDAQQMGNPQANWANARAGAGAIVSDQATEEVMSWGVGKIAGVAGVVVFGHGARHLIGTALEKEAVEAAIEKEVQFVSKEASQTGSFWGRVTVNGQVIEYRAHTLPNGTINVGTYYTPKP
jgi:RHS repeat-associated protein